MKNTSAISIIIPNYNDADALPNVLDSLFDTISKMDIEYEILIINDGSTDQSENILKQDKRIKLINHPYNKGYGASLKTGIRNAKGEKIIVLDSDGQHSSEYIRKLSELLNEYDMIIGERTDKAFQIETRKLGKKILKLICEYLVEQNIPDFNSGYRAFDRKLMMELLNIMPNGFSFSTTSTLAFIKEGYKIGTFALEVKARMGRKSNVRFFKDGFKTLLLIFRIVMLFNPLKIFFPSSIFFSFFGLSYGIYSFIVDGRFANSAVVITIFGMLLFFFGLIADQISMINRKKVG